MASYLETLSTYSPQILAEGCNTFKRRSTRFAPSVGEIYDACAEMQHKAIQAQKAQHLRLAKPEYEYPDEHRRIMQSQWDELLASLRAPEDLSRFEVSKGTKPAKPIVSRVVPLSFLDRWERENGREYPGRDRVTDVSNYREAAE